jgi:hypothetical protein
MKRLIALVLALVVNTASADTTGNVLSGTAWTGVTNGTLPANRMPGSALLYDTATGTVNWSYNTATAAKTTAINNALSGSGIQVGGYNYTYDLRNMNGDNRQSSTDTMTVVTKMTSNTGATLLSNTNTHNTRFDWTTFSGTQSLSSPAAPSSLGNLSISFTSRDTGYWAGYFGPEVRNVGMSLNYTADPCMTNPAYSTSCANYNTVSTSNNLVPNPTAYATYGSSVDNSYAINQALALSGANVMIHGFQWGYTANANGPYCASWLIVCWDQRTPSVTTNVNITDNTGASLYQVSRTYTNSYNTTDYRYVFPSSKNLATLGSFNFTATTNDAAYVGDMWSKALYTPDPCTVNPLSSSSCPGYQQAYHDQQCAANPLYAVDCAGYQQAYLTMQCSANPLYSPSCPGYQQAYFTQQCTANPLYDSQCPGYATAYHSQQCSISALYATDCPGYQQALFTQTCNNNPLSSTQCTGYTAAYHNQQCSINPLYMSDCTGYQTAYHNQQCSANPLYATDCYGYAAALQAKQVADACKANPQPGCSNYVAPPAPVAVVTTSTAATTVSTGVADPVASAAITTPATTSPTSVTSVTSVVTTAPAPASANPVAAATNAATTPAPAPAPTAEAKVEAKKTEGAVARAAARGNAAAAAKDAVAKATSAKSLEDQAATQGLVVGLMGYVPGFNAYQNALVPDVNAMQMARQYNKPNVDNRSAQRRLSGASDLKWQEMVDSQYRLGDQK